MNVSSKLYEELPAQKIYEVVQKHFGSSSEIEYSLLKGGLFNTTYKLVLHSPMREFIFRVGPVNRQFLLPFEQHLMNAEVEVYTLFSKNQIPCPTVLVCDSTKSIVDRDYMITEYIPSVPLSDESIPQDVKAELYEQAGRWTAEIHSIIGSKFGRVSDIQQTGGYDHWVDFLRAQAIETGVKCLEYEVFGESVVSRMIKIYEDTSRLYENITIPQLIHADLWAGNILVRLNKITNKYELAAIIDADRALFGDVDFEFASPWITNESFLKGYGKQDRDHDPLRALKKDTYQLLFHFIDSYVWKVQYNNMVEYENNKQRAMDLLSSIEAEIYM
ncbi:phosphotransferase family protein [Paenibacillus segetis]|uniref:Aminoglycoside phosphotransferase domain-containing protein n=1 Tax=Paenibacillus segetis TaxID=1325360 RepID=A0ABQ1YTV2_9BACL|nr:phosphotransferase [Paenibacillus segetis]GGH36330.1 hypothetical protein GCM10008013_43140 [Paenibacillus segetis]